MYSFKESILVRKTYSPSIIVVEQQYEPIKNSILVRKTHFLSFIVRSQQHEPVKSLDLKQISISSKLLSILSGFLKDRKQRVTLNREVKAGVHQRTFFGLLLFLVSINDLADGLSSNAKLFTDDLFFFGNPRC